jgi:RNA polymerase sigma factor (sigma-70 family)
MAPERDGTTRKRLRTLFGVGSMTGLTDGQLLERFAVGRGEAAELAFAAIIERHGPMVLRTCRAILRSDHEAEDAFQATFLVLVIKAGSLWVEDSLGPWLHRVACRIAVRARSAADRRRETERRAAEMSGSPRSDEGRELGPILHEEIDRLPSRYRIPIVLCDLEGRTQDEAARHLKCPIGTVKSRLARGRERLRGRLVRRGLAPAVGAFGTILLAAEVPAALVESTSRAAVARALTAGVVPASVSQMTRGALRAMRHSMIMRVGGIVLVVGLAAAGVGRFAPRASGGPAVEPQGKVAPAEPGPPEPKEQPDPEKRRLELATRRAHQEVAEIEYEAKKEWLRAAINRLGQLELQGMVGVPRLGMVGVPRRETNDPEERRKALQDLEHERLRLSEYIEKMKDELIHKGISIHVKKLELQE